MRGSIIRYMYHEIGDELLNQGLIPYIPKYKTMHNKHSWGVIHQNWKGIFVDISINTSSFDPDFQHFWSASTWFHLIDTICHEFAHMKEWEHGPLHTKLTFDYLVIAYDLLLHDDNLNKRIEFINSYDEFKNSEDFKVFFDALFESETDPNSDKVVNKFDYFNFCLISGFVFSLFVVELTYFFVVDLFFVRPPPLLNIN